MPNLSGQSIGRYHIIEPLGEGGMATVYKAFDTRLETDVAIKVIRTDRFTPEMLTEALKRFEREAKSLARLTHPNIVKVTDYGEYEGQPYLVMMYLPGGTLKERLGQPMPWSEAARILIPIAHALDFAHQQGVIHRDIKPSNILITKSGEPMLSDFGIAKILSEDVTAGLTSSSMAMGTPEYMAPEQVKAKSVDARADIYSLGIVFYEMVTGRRPFEADTPLAVLFKHASDPLPRPSRFVPGLPSIVENTLYKALAKKPEDRYQTMGEFAAALEKMAINDRSSVVSKRKTKKAEGKREGFEKTNVRAAPTIFARTTAGQKVEGKKNNLETATAHAVPAVNVPIAVESEKPVKPVRSFKLPISLGILVVVLGISIPLGIRFLKPVTETQVPLVVLPTNTATRTPMPTFTPTNTLTPIATLPPSPTVTLTPEFGIGSTWTRPADDMVMVYVPAGNFLMGSTDADIAQALRYRSYEIYKYDYEKPQHSVYLDAFWIDQTEVTNKMYALCVAAGKCNPPRYGGWYKGENYYGSTAHNDYPVIFVSWNDVNTYCQWAGARLPTEAEWEKAARGTDGRLYPWGEGIDCQKANYHSCVGDTVRVGSYYAGKSPYGAYDMAGNVAEWVADWYSEIYYANSPANNPTGPTSGEYRIRRGGSWHDSDIINDVRAAARNMDSPDSGNSNVGFRCVRSTK